MPDESIALTAYVSPASVNLYRELLRFAAGPALSILMPMYWHPSIAPGCAVISASLFSVVNVPPCAGVNTAYWLPSESAIVDGVAPDITHGIGVDDGCV